MKFEVRPMSDVPPRKRPGDEAWSPIIQAFDALEPGKALYIEADARHKPRGIQVALKRRLKDAVQLRPDDNGVWLWRTYDSAAARETQRAAPSAAARPLAAAANGAGPT